MKRLLVILLLTSLLCGCAATQTPSVSEETKLQIEKEVLPGGVWVQTDYSQYAPQENLESKYTRLSDDFISELQPSDDYGMLYPFIGSLIEDYNYCYVDPIKKYGMVDENGRIVVDAVYRRIAPVRHNYNSRGEQLPMWTLETAEGTAIATFDGTFVTKPIYSYAEAYEEYVLAYMQNAEGIRVAHVYDKTGKLCLDSSAWALSDRIASADVNSGEVDSGIYSYGCGLFGLYLEDGWYYADWDGNLIAGPYPLGECFSDGYALVCLRKLGRNTFDTYAYIDTEGNQLLDTEFFHAESFQDGFAGASITGEDALLISATDGVIFRCEGEHCTVENSIFQVRDLYGREQFYDLTGKLLYESTDAGNYTVLKGGKFAYDYYDNVVINLETGKKPQVSTFQNVTDAECHEDPSKPLLSKYHGSYHYCVADENGNILLETDDITVFYEDPLTRQGYYIVGFDRTKICSLQWEAPFEPGCKCDRIFGGRILCFDERGSYHYDTEGNLLFYYPYPTGNGD